VRQQDDEGDGELGSGLLRVGQTGQFGQDRDELDTDRQQLFVQLPQMEHMRRFVTQIARGTRTHRGTERLMCGARRDGYHGQVGCLCAGDGAHPVLNPRGRGTGVGLEDRQVLPPCPVDEFALLGR
jgi:hypothetical protein